MMVIIVIIILCVSFKHVKCWKNWIWDHWYYKE